MSNLMVASQAKKLAASLNLEANEKELIETLKATVFKGNPTDAQMSALMIVARQYNLNPFVREIFAYPDKQNGIVPVVSVDGWIKIITTHPQYDGMEFKYSEEIVSMPKAKPCPSYVECVIYRKDVSRPTVVREYLDEAYKETSFTSPWQTHTKRFLRHRALIQCGRVAFGLSGIYEPDEAESIQGEKIINPMPGEEGFAPSFSDFEKLLKSIDSMEICDFKTIDTTKFSEQEVARIKLACKTRKQQIIDASVVDTVDQKNKESSQLKPSEQHGINWLDLIQTTSDEAMSALADSIPDSDMPGVISSITDSEILNVLYKALNPEKQSKYNRLFDDRATEIIN